MELNPEETTPAAEVSENQEAVAPVRRRASRRVTAAAGAASDVTVTTTEPPVAQAPSADTPAEPEAPAAPKRATRSRKKVEPQADSEAAQPEQTSDTAGGSASETTASEAPAEEAPKKRATRSRKKPEPAPEAQSEPAQADAAQAEPKKAESQRAESEQSSSDETVTESSAPEEQQEASNGRRSRRRSNTAGKTDKTDKPDKSEKVEKSDRSDASEPTEKSDEGSNEQAGDEGKSRGRNSKQDKQDNNKQDSSKSDADKQDGNSRSSRTRQRDRKRRGGDDHEVEITEDDVLLPIAGILDVLDNYAFVRTSGYLPGVSDVYVALGQVKKYGLRRGDAIVGAIRQPREGDGGGRQKYNAIVKIDSVNGKPVEETEKRPDIADMTAIFPVEPLRFAQAGSKSLGAEIDKHAPMGLGQRALLTLPAKISSTRVLADLAASVTAGSPDAHLVVVATNMRPEEATHLQRSVSGEVVAATFDRAAEDQVTIVELAVDRARRLAELGHDVVVLLHSLSDLAHAYEQHNQGGRTTPEAARAQAITQVKHVLAAARNLENGGSLTLIATARTKSGSAFDKEVLRAIRPLANSMVKLTGTGNELEVDAEKSYTISF